MNHQHIDAHHDESISGLHQEHVNHANDLEPEAERSRHGDVH